MIAANPNSLCDEAKLYYFDLLTNEGDDLVPEFVVDHVSQCQRCQEQMDRLKGVFLQTEVFDTSDQGLVSSALAVMLRLHFAYIGKRVTCRTVRPFLPSLLEPTLEVRIPTPITAHLHNCRQCAEDLETSRRLNLNARQLRQLGQLFAEELNHDSAKCSEVGQVITSVAAMDFDGIAAETLKHLCKCPACQDLLLQERQEMCDGLPEYDQSPEFPCESVSATDIFDYVVPYSLDPANDQYAKFRGSLTSHLRSCKTCLAKLQELHRVIYGVAERAESGVVTTYHVDESAEAQSLGESSDLYAGFPIRVEIAGCEDRVSVERPATTIDYAASLKQRAPALNAKPLLRTGLAAAAVILVGLAFLLNAPTAKAVTIEQIYRAIRSVRNVYIRVVGSDGKETTQELWVSKTLKLRQVKTGNESILFDLPNKVVWEKRWDTDVAEKAPLSDEMITNTERQIAGFWGLVPFTDLSALPKDAQWNSVAGNGPKAAGDTEIYDLTWTDKARDGSVVLRRWRFFVEPKTNLPQSTEFYQKSATDGDYTLVSAMVVEYLTDGQMQAVFEEASSQAVSFR